MTPRNEWLPLSGRMSHFPRRDVRGFRLWVLELESREAAGSLLNPLLPDPFLGLIDLPQASGFAPPTESISQPAERWLTRPTAWLPPQWPIEETQPKVVIQSACPDARGVAARFGLSDDLFGGVVSPASLPATNPISSANRASVGSNEAFFTPSAVSAQIVGTVPEAPESQPQLPGAASAVVNYDTLDEPIPNEAPQAYDDEITVSEDESIVFDPTVNDTDPDEGDELLVSSVQAETDHGRTFWEEGGLIRYIPNPNYENTSGQPYYTDDTFTYTVTDGVDESTATVYVAVTAVNDAPQAANDAGIFINTMYEYPYGDPESIFQYQPSYNPYLVINDRDYDGGTTQLTVQSGDVILTDVNGNPTKGVVSVLTNGSYTWGGPKGWTGETSFKYRSSDSQGGKSEWVTVKLIASRSSEGTGSVSATADIVAVGDGPDTGNVLTNDSGSFVVLNTQPSSGRLTKFGFDGAVEFLSDHTRSEPTFTYTLFNTNGRVRATAEVETTAVNLTAWHGQYKAATGSQPESKPVGELNEGLGFAGNFLIPVFKASGAFTVGNFNDSDADGLIDSADNEVDGPVNVNYAGSGEVDLIRITMKKPAPIEQKQVTLKITQPAAGIAPPRVWKEQRKGGQQNLVTLTNNMASFAVDDNFPTALWVELRGVSESLRDFKIEMSYDMATDSVGATAIWTKHNPNASHAWPDGYFMNSNNDPALRMVGGLRELPEDADARIMKSIFIDRGRSLGLSTTPVLLGIGRYRMINSEVSKFTVLPSGLTPYTMLNIVKFDITRSFESKGKNTYQGNNGPVSTPWDDKWPTWIDTAIDEPPAPYIQTDNDVDLRYNSGTGIRSTDNMYSWDAPGFKDYAATAAGAMAWSGSAKAIVRWTDSLTRDNFFDFVRIRIGSAWLGGPGLEGSRSSVFYAWSNMQRLREDPPAVGGVYHMKRVNELVVAGIPIPDAIIENRIEKGHIDVAVPGGGVS